MKETKQTVFTQDQQLVNADTRITGVTQPGNRTEQRIIDLLAEKDEEIKSLRVQNKDLDYLLNSRRNKFEQQRIERLRELEAKIAKLEAKESKEKAKELTKIQGILTSNLRSRKSSDTPYMAFFRLEECIDCENTKTLRKALMPKHKSCEECAEQKCKDCEVPVVFRLISKNHRMHEMEPKEPCFNPREHLQNPNLKKGQTVILEGQWANSKDSNRPSFTCYSYQVLKGDNK